MCYHLGLLDLREFVDGAGRSPFGKWFHSLSAVAAANVTVALERLAAGNMSIAKSVGKGVHELRIDFGPGYRVYFGWDGERIVILLGGGQKKRQSEDILRAQLHWVTYRKRKQEE